LPRPLPHILTLLLFLLTGWFPAASFLAGGIVPIALQGYAYQLNANGLRTHISELSGRSIAHTFDALQRLTSETIASTLPASHLSLGTLTYTYDAASNRSSRTSTGTVSQLLPNQSHTFTANDRLSSDTYDANGNTTSSLLTSHPALGTLSATDVYSFDNRLIRRTRADGLTIDLTYNPDGHRLTKLVSQSGLTQRLHHYLTDPNNPTGYSQVVEEKDPLAPAAEQLKKVHLYGHDLIATQSSPGLQSAPLHYYQYDGLGSIRGITDESGDLQETYDYDAYGTLIGLAKRNATSGELEPVDLTSSDSALRTPTSEYLFTGEQWDSDLDMYFLRARYLNTQTGRFHTQDTYEGRNGEPLTLHKYLYVHGNPVMATDPSGQMLLDMSIAIYGFLKLNVLDNARVMGVAKGIGVGLTAITIAAAIGDPTGFYQEVQQDVAAFGPLGIETAALRINARRAKTLITPFFNRSRSAIERLKDFNEAARALKSANGMYNKATVAVGEIVGDEAGDFMVATSSMRSNSITPPFKAPNC
jgi:RHS repeat-associated protein